MPVQEDFIEQAAPFRAELIAHCYRMLGSVHDAEDLVQETYLRGWRAMRRSRSAPRCGPGCTASRPPRACVRCRTAPAGCCRPGLARRRSTRRRTSTPARADILAGAAARCADSRDRFSAKQSVRLALVTALQELPARQRAVLILRDVVQFSAAEVAELLETTPAAVNSALQRARAHLADVAATDDDMAEPDDKNLPCACRALLRGIRERRRRRPDRASAGRRQARNATLRDVVHRP